MLVFVRHGESVGNTLSQDERAKLPVPNHLYMLTEVGKMQAVIVGEYLKAKFGRNHFNVGFYSNFLRTEQTFGFIRSKIESRGMAIMEDSRLNEKWDGIFHDLSSNSIALLHPEQISLRERSGYYMYRAPGGENVPDVELRIRSFLSEYFETMIQRNVLVVGHGRWFQIFRKLFHSWSVQKFLDVKENEVPKNCTVSIYDSYALDQRTPGTHVVPWEGKVTETKTELA